MGPGGPADAGRADSAAAKRSSREDWSAEAVVTISAGAENRNSSRVNPALTIYAWALRVASRLGAKGYANEHVTARPDPVRA